VSVGKYRRFGGICFLYVQDSGSQELLDVFVSVVNCVKREDGDSKISQNTIKIYKSKRRRIPKDLNFHEHHCKNFNTFTEKRLKYLNHILILIRK
jgi:hypothetical protein